MTSAAKLEFKDVRGLLEPKSVVVVGASDRAGNVGADTVRRLVKFGFPGPVWVINRAGEPVDSVLGYTDFSELPQVPDLAVLAVPAAALSATVRAAARSGIRYGLAYAGGFAEAGGGGIELQRELIATCEETGFTLCGPNCVGIINSAIPVTLTFATALQEVDELRAGKISMVSQSGGIGTATWGLARNAGFQFRCLISSGNEVVVSFADYLYALAQDGGTEVIAGYLEGVTDGKKLVAALSEARRRGKKVVLIKAGTTAASARAASAHTGSLVGEDRVYDAIFREFGVIRVYSVGELLDTLLLLVSTKGKVPAGPGVGIISFGGGSGVLSTDQCAQSGLDAPALSDACKAELRQNLVPMATAANPLDLTPSTAFSPDAMAKLPKALDTLAAQNDIHALLFQVGSMGSRKKEIAGAIVEFASRTDKPYCVAWTSAPAGAAEGLAEHGLYAFAEPARAIASLGRLYSANQMALPVSSGDFSQGAVLMDWAKFVPESKAPFVVSEDRCHEILRAANLPAAPGKLAKSESAALQIAKGFSASAVLKGISPAVTHRAAAGLVSVDLRSPQEISQAYRALSDRAQDLGVKLDGIYVQEMRKGGTELLVSAFRDPTFGVMIAIGAGGVFTEAIRDVVTVRAPVDSNSAVTMLRRLRMRPKNAEYGSQVELAAARFIVEFSVLAMTAPWKSFVFEINPLKWGDEVVAVDGLLVVDSV